MSDASPSISLEDLVQLPPPGGDHPVQVQWSPDGRWLTFLHDPTGGMTRQLYALDPDTGERRIAVEPPGGGVREGELSLEEQLRRERMRERGLGITRYAWAGDDRLIVPLGSDLYVQEGLDGDLRALVSGAEHPVLDPQASPDGAQIAFVQDAELCVVPFTGGTPRQLTTGARGTGRTHGLAEYIAQEEMGRHHGFWWSTDGEKIAFTEVDETHIPVWRIPHEGREQPSWEDHRYPFAGADNAEVRLFVVDASGGAPVPVDLTAGGQLEVEYLARVLWLEDGALLAVVQDRAQQRLDVLRADPDTGATTVVRTETSDVWINLDDHLRALSGEPGAFLWSTERTGFKHLVRVAADGSETVLTAGEWMVDRVCAVDEDARVLYILATADGAVERHLYRVPLDGSQQLERLTSEPGFHTTVVEVQTGRFADTASGLQQPFALTIRSLEDGAVQRGVHESADPRLTRLDLRPPRLVSVPTSDGEATLDGAVFLPDGEGPWPVVVQVYGGPHAQRVVNRWDLTADLRAQYLRQRGFLVFRLDNRGAARRGLAFEGALRHDMGNVEVSDQVDGVRWLVAQGWADPGRVGIRGWSYGGYMSAMALMRAPETFHVGVAGAPVTHWDGYDTHYTERYMGTPQDNPDGYRRSSVMHHVDGLRGRLLLVHGGIDENVHFRHTARLLQALVRADKDAEVLLFPDERHVPRSPHDRIYMEKRVLGFLTSELSR